ncbi:L-type lectin-domain containing receptor kinase VII.1-like [Dorcoceras hygrometricum]|uniref:L-type lectin-domain containing receptor kinase VII.1-like n=1 Tax=Dorcoceras hygrometricum TaxID=472368 RepID=A0A2Z7D5S5_9LAMI|nr:L-type lectin-domain containing receptor kinase VII.1-like [Dorcoceras hygrometricum]
MTSPERRPPPRNHVRRKAARGRTAARITAQPIARPASGAKQRPATTLQSLGQSTTRRDIARPARKRPASELPTAQHRAAISRHVSIASLIQALNMASGRAPCAASALVLAAMMMWHRHARRHRGRCDDDFASFRF